METIIEEQEVESPDGEVTDPIVEKATVQGWVPKEDFRGDPNRWVDAKQFVERGENIIPILKERNEHLAKEVRETKESVKELADFYKKAEERAYQRAVQDMEARKLSAVELGDVQAFKEVEIERASLEREKPVFKTPPPEEPVQMQDFRKNNDWYEKDVELTSEADALGVAYAKQGMAYDKILEKVQSAVKSLHPEKFSNARRDTAPVVESVESSMGLPRRSISKNYGNLPADAQAQCNKFVKQGLLTKEEYIRDYDWT